MAAGTAALDCAGLLRNIHEVMQAEDVLHGAGVPCDLIPVPRDISSDCGMALVYACAADERVKALLAGKDLALLALYRREGSRFAVVFDRRRAEG